AVRESVARTRPRLVAPSGVLLPSRGRAWGTQSYEPTALINANVVSVRDGRVTPNATIVLRDGRIASVGAGPPPAGVHILDLKGTYVLPGLIDAHTHADTLAAFRTALESGVTTMRSAG